MVYVNYTSSLNNGNGKDISAAHNPYLQLFSLKESQKSITRSEDVKLLSPYLVFDVKNSDSKVERLGNKIAHNPEALDSCFSLFPPFFFPTFFPQLTSY